MKNQQVQAAILANFLFFLFLSFLVIHRSVLVILVAVLVIASAVTVWIALSERVTGPSGSTQFYTSACNVPLDEPQVHLASLGATVYGKLDSSGRLRKFFGIPYGRNVSTARRFQLAQNVTSLGENGSFYAHVHGPQCPQGDLADPSMDEECLTLSIWVPVVCPASSPLKTVLVVVASEWFQFDNTGQLDRKWATLSLGGDIVIVTIKHRLGLLGFLDANLNEASGYVGVEDVFLALKWISEHIRAFHGDPASLVGFGFGAGAYIASIDLFDQTQSKQKFFKRLLLDGVSPASLLPRLKPDDLRNLAISLQCPTTTSTSSLVECLRANDLKRIYEEAAKLSLLFTPNCDRPPFDGCDKIFAKLPGSLAGVAILCGYNKNDGHELFRRYILKQSRKLDSQNPEEMFDKLQIFFTGKKGKHNFKDLPVQVQRELNEAGKAREQGFSELVSDMVLRCPMIELAREMTAKGASVHLYGSGGAHNLLEPALMMADIVAFVKQGSVSWPMFSKGNVMLLANDTSRQLVKSEGNDCSLTHQISRALIQ
ncbi:acetylcholinesterase-1-like [Dermacentor variabilis]|uniref:acetylcholinesterase-1-like n=1 Tax=Dermacentor variabilis TaxID=34621 RepID=UPI003F5C0E70